VSSIVKQKVGNKIYLYESISYRNSKGEPRNKRTIIGKIDPVSGQPRYKPEHLDRLAAAGKIPQNMQTASSFTFEEIQQSSIRDYGAFYLFEKIAEQTGLLSSLKHALPECWEEIFNLAAYLVSTGDPFAYCEDWLADTAAYPVGDMTSQRISELLSAVSIKQRDDFYQAWCAKRSEKEYLALDITSTSSYSELVEGVEWGYNRDGVNLPQINTCLLMGYDSRLPIYQSVYYGSLKDVSTLQNTLNTFRALAGQKPIIAVMDKGFYSKKNVNAMLNPESRVDFLVAVPFSNKFAKDLVISGKKDIDTLANVIVCSAKESLRAVTKIQDWNGGHELYTHIYYNPRKAIGIREDLYTYVTSLRDNALEQPGKYVLCPEYTKYLDIRPDNEKYTVNIKEDVVESELLNAGWMVIISNYVSDAKEALLIYRGKDIAEKGFQRLKNNLDMGRIRVHSNASMQNKVFVGFLSLILVSAIHNTMTDKKLYSKMTLKKLILILQKLKIQFVNGVRVMFPLTKEQKDIFQAFGFLIPV
jgi:hypothetical protein